MSCLMAWLETQHMTAILVAQVMCHQIEQLKEEIKEKDVRMIEADGNFTEQGGSFYDEGIPAVLHFPSR